MRFGFTQFNNMIGKYLRLILLMYSLKRYIGLFNPAHGRQRTPCELKSAQERGHGRISHSNSANMRSCPHCGATPQNLSNPVLPSVAGFKKSVAEKGEKETKKEEEKESEIETTTLVRSLMTYLPKDCLYDI